MDPNAMPCLVTAYRLNKNNKEALMLMGVSCVNEYRNEDATYYLESWLRQSPDYAHLVQNTEDAASVPAVPSSHTPSATDTAVDELLSGWKLPENVTTWLPSLDDSDNLDDYSSKWAEEFRAIQNASNFEDIFGQTSAREETTEALVSKFRAAELISPKNIDIKLILGVLCSAMSDFSESRAYFEKAVQVDAFSYSAWNKLGATRANNSQPGHALAAYACALQIRPRYVRCIANVGIAYLAQGEYSSALTWFLKAHSLNPDYSDSWSHIGAAIRRSSHELYEALEKHDLAAFAAYRNDDISLPLQKEFPDVDAWEIAARFQVIMKYVTPPRSEVPEEKKQRLSMAELMEYVASGRTPPDVRLVNDKPPNPQAPILKGARKAPLKPWKKQAAAEGEAGSAPASAPAPAPAVIEAPSPKITDNTEQAVPRIPAAIKPPEEWLPIFTVDAFAAAPYTGNPAAVCMLRHELADEQMLRIANEMNLSETAFVIPQGQGTNFSTAKRFGLRWFTPTNEVPLCGHATLATAHALFFENRYPGTSITFATLSGDLVVSRSATSATRLAMDLPRGEPAVISNDTAGVAGAVGALGLAAGDLVHTAICRKTRKLLLEVSSIAAVLSVKPNFEQLLAIDWTTADIPVKGIIVTTRGGKHTASHSDERFAHHDVVSRYFAPWNGIPEDPVTGSAHTVISAYWTAKLRPAAGAEPLVAYQASARGGELVLFDYADTNRVTVEGVAITVTGGRLRAY
eukprot:TRINITY_DN2615_c0_g1_i4.p1 TRINITY_DN2615_c0_g1~~TRINITY_DN2615_c0_g1_i4.p1  ORF type:complete len:743 (-),score=102.60 TRINITY_DN2615_c0_g1_i4:98-2326(-)